MTETTVPPLRDTPPTDQRPGPPPYRRLLRSRTNRQLTGVCGGIARYAGVDATVIRIGAVLATVFTGGTAALAYLIAAVLIPEE
jgi:phage shock protein C